MTPAPLPESSPSRHGVNADGIGAFLDAVEDIELHSLMILRHGHVIASGWWEPYGPDRPHLLYSLSKSFTSTAAGLAAAEGLLDLDAPVLSYFPELDADVTDPRSRAMLVRHIASMSSGHLTDTWPAVREEDPDRPVRGFLRLPPDRDPGTVFTYNQSCTYTLASIIQRVTGQPLTAYLRPRLFDVIGIGAADWDEFPPGQALGFTGLYATTDAIARLGQLYLRNGQWDGHQVIPREWVAEATRAHVATRPDATFDWRQGYGFQFWMARHGYRGDGAYGQFCLVLPEHDAVVAITAGTENMQGILDAVWAHLLPAFRAPDASGTGSAAMDTVAAVADTALAKRLAQLRLPAHAATAGPRGPWPDAAIVLTPADGVCEAFPSLRRVRVEDQNVTLSDDTLSVELRLVAGDWHVTDGPVPAAASGGWTAPDTLAIDVVFLETPHRLSLTCSLGDRTFRARWHTQPLSTLDSLSRLRSPRY
jgi:CubicO group peptidase (beta-lactamase class C family)